jgi:hypothetical protein
LLSLRLLSLCFWGHLPLLPRWYHLPHTTLSLYSLPKCKTHTHTHTHTLSPFLPLLPPCTLPTCSSSSSLYAYYLSLVSG